MPQLRLRLPTRPAGGGGRVREAVVLSGGGSLGASQVGALRALLEVGIRPDVLVGCSVGAINAAFLAVDPTLARVGQLERFWRGLTHKDVFGGNRRLMATHLVRGDAHLYEPDALRGLIRRTIPVRDLAETAVPVHVVTTDLHTGLPCWWSSGDPVTVLSASACLPAVFPPVPMGGSLHVDGGVTAPVPVQRALDLGATRTWVLDVSGGTLGRRDERMNALDVLLLSFAITRSHLDRVDGPPRRGQTVVRVQGLGRQGHELRDFSRTAQLMQQGYDATRTAVERELRTVPLPRSG